MHPLRWACAFWWGSYPGTWLGKRHPHKDYWAKDSLLRRIWGWRWKAIVISVGSGSARVRGLRIGIRAGKGEISDRGGCVDERLEQGAGNWRVSEETSGRSWEKQDAKCSTIISCVEYSCTWG